MRFKVVEKQAAHIRGKVLTPGQLASRRHINLPGIKINLPAFTEKDRADTLVGVAEGIDTVALSFVREAGDIEALRKFLRSQGSRARIIATHMLESMISSPMPTRAEITDAANAVYERADCVMLSGVTTVGRYPFECVGVLDKLARRIERETPAVFVPPAHLQGDKLRLLQTAVQFANQLQGSALLTFTRQGFMTTNLAAMRPASTPIFAFTHSVETLRQLRLLRATEPFLISLASEPNETIERAIAMLRRDGRVQPGARW